MPLTFQRECVDDFKRDSVALLPRHFEELSLHKDKVGFAMDFDMYHRAEKNRMLYILTARVDGQMVGYIISLVAKNHGHNRDAGPYSTTDMFWVAPECRNGTGAKMLMENERRLKALGVKRAAISSKLKDLHLELFTRLGWQATDMVFHKFL
jgi:ribosomal protein S18 acetylase RimI-like enzyme